MIELHSGDILAFSEKGIKPWFTQLSAVSLPNIGPIGRWGLAGFSSLAIANNVWGKPLVYESTFAERPPCVRSNRQTPIGGQAHYVEDMLRIRGSVFRFPLVCPLYTHEEDRLLAFVDYCISRDIGNLALCSAALTHIGRLPEWRSWYKTPTCFIRYCQRQRVLGDGILISE